MKKNYPFNLFNLNHNNFKKFINTKLKYKKSYLSGIKFNKTLRDINIAFDIS
jgi:hypothetical protein